MLKVNTKIFEVEVLLTMTLATVWDMARILTEVKAELETTKETVLENTFEFDQNVELITSINEQLHYVNTNLENLGEVLLVHEEKIFKAPTDANKSKQIFCLN